MQDLVRAPCRPGLEGRPRRASARRAPRPRGERPRGRAQPSAPAHGRARDDADGRAQASRARRAAGHGRLGQGRHVKHCRGGAQPDERGVAAQGADLDGARPRLPLARPPGASAARRDRHLQPLALRGRARRPRRKARCPSRSGSSATRPSTRSSSTSRTRARRSSSCSSTSREDEQAKRYRERLSDPTKNWKFSADDLAKRTQWDDYMTPTAPCSSARRPTGARHIVPADHKWVRNAVVTEVSHRRSRARPAVAGADSLPELQGAGRRGAGSARKTTLGLGFRLAPCAPLRLSAGERVSARRRFYLWKWVPGGRSRRRLPQATTGLLPAELAAACTSSE